MSSGIERVTCALGKATLWCNLGNMGRVYCGKHAEQHRHSLQPWPFKYSQWWCGSILFRIQLKQNVLLPKSKLWNESFKCFFLITISKPSSKVPIKLGGKTVCLIVLVHVLGKSFQLALSQLKSMWERKLFSWDILVKWWIRNCRWGQWRRRLGRRHCELFQRKGDHWKFTKCGKIGLVTAQRNWTSQTQIPQTVLNHVLESGEWQVIPGGTDQMRWSVLLLGQAWGLTGLHSSCGSFWTNDSSREMCQQWRGFLCCHSSLLRDKWLGTIMRKTIVENNCSMWLIMAETPWLWMCVQEDQEFKTLCHILMPSCHNILIQGQKVPNPTNREPGWETVV